MEAGIASDRRDHSWYRDDISCIENLIGDDLKRGTFDVSVGASAVSQTTDRKSDHPFRAGPDFVCFRKGNHAVNLYGISVSWQSDGIYRSPCNFTGFI